MTSIELHYLGTHMDLGYQLLTSFGYTQEQLDSIGFYRPLVTLSSQETRDTLLDFLTSQSVYSALYQVLTDHKVKGVHYVLQCFCDSVRDDQGCLYDTPSPDKILKGWASVERDIIPNLGEVLITIEYR